MTYEVFIVVCPSWQVAFMIILLPSNLRSFWEHISLVAPMPNSRICACTDSSRHIVVRLLRSGWLLVERDTSHRPDLSTGGSAASTLQAQARPQRPTMPE